MPAHTDEAADLATMNWPDLQLSGLVEIFEDGGSGAQAESDTDLSVIQEHSGGPGGTGDTAEISEIAEIP